MMEILITLAVSFLFAGVLAILLAVWLCQY